MSTPILTPINFLIYSSRIIASEPYNSVMKRNREKRNNLWKLGPLEVCELTRDQKYNRRQLQQTNKQTNRNGERFV